jgi:LysM repeat protein
MLTLVKADLAIACGPDFPNWLLTQGDQAVLVAPEGNFAAELARMDLGRMRLRALPPEPASSYFAQSTQAELADLRRALKQADTPDEVLNRICTEHQRQRRQLEQLLQTEPTATGSDSENPQEAANSSQMAQRSRQETLHVQVTDGLPGEFADYFEGFIAWHDPALTDKRTARAAWERLLARPEAERRYKSTWAAFMLGKSWEETDPEKAVGYFKQVRELAQQGYRDSVGLAAASLGLEARVCLNRTNFERAIELYLEQMASRDPTATNSLATAATKALAAGPETLRALARNPRTQKVITAHIISRSRNASVYAGASSEQGEQPPKGPSAAASWLAAVEEAGVKDMDAAEALALAAYRANDMSAAQRWIRRAPGSLLAQWLQAKLLLRSGKLQSAAALLARLSPQFPIVHEGTNAPAPSERKDTLTVRGDDYSTSEVSAERQVRGELGVLRLARGEYTQALDALLNGGFWMDASYVAERVLTLDELKSYVDSFWPAVTPAQVAEEQERLGDSEVCPAILREKIRYLLARRLARAARGEQARDYYPTPWLGAFDQLMENLRAGWNETATPEQRAQALFHAALITRTNGMELIGTEVAPDWHYHLGDFEAGVTGNDRARNTLAAVVRPLEDELRRNAAQNPEPNERFHYRYQAASLAWEAAKLLPDNDERTAYVLWRGGSFLKARDPQFADFFYKALVRRNRKTVLGAEADRQRWFPIIDENGNIVPRKRMTLPQSEAPAGENMQQPSTDENSETETATEPAPASVSDAAPSGYRYVVHRGDSLASIAEAFNNAEVTATLRDILAANPGLDPARLKVGQVLDIPANATLLNVTRGAGQGR